MIRFRSFPSTAILAFIFGSAWLVIGASRAKPAAPRSEKKAVIGYVFARKGRLPDDPIRGDLLTHINYAFANIKNGQLSAEKPDDAENLKALTSLRTRFPQLKVLISVGGWTWSGGFSEMSLSRASRKKFIDSAVAFVRQTTLMASISIGNTPVFPEPAIRTGLKTGEISPSSSVSCGGG
jgi:chitinase